MTQFDTTKLSDLITERYGSQKACAIATGISQSSLSRRLSGGGEFSASEIKSLVKALKIKPKDIDSYFFTERVAQKQL